MTSHARIEGLGPERTLNRVGGRLLANEDDPILQRIVQSAALAVGAPIALVSLVLDNIQLFRAQVGLPADLARVAATDRDISFCQFVVRDDALFEVGDALENPRVPQALVESHGIRAYLGAPIHLDGQPLGSLCVIDTRPRQFTQTERAHLRALAREVDARIAEWLAAEQLAERLRDATSPVLTRMRDDLTLLGCARDELLIARSELLARQRAEDVSDPVFLSWSVSRDRAALVGQLGTAVDLIERSSERLLDGVRDLEALIERSVSSSTAARVILLAEGPCRLAADAVGGIEWGATATEHRIARPAASAALLVSAVVAVMTREAPRSYRDGLHVTVSEDRGGVIFEIGGPPVSAERLLGGCRAIEVGPIDTTGVRFSASDGRLRLWLQAVQRGG